MPLKIWARSAVLPDRLLDSAVVTVDTGRITGVTPGDPDEADVVLDDGLLTPGLIDLQVNGYYGTDFVDASPQDWDRVTARLPETGATAIAPTFITAPVEHLASRLSSTAAVLKKLDARRCRVLGVHLEGPFLSHRRRGAHNSDHLCDPSPQSVAMLVDAAPGTLLYVTLAPERAGGLDAVRQLVSAGVLVSVGHSDATAEQVTDAANAGARMVTHLFNAQRPLHHRDPGVPGVALTDARFTSGLIIDLHHVAGAVCRLAFAAAPDRIALVTDALSVAGMPPGRYALGGQPVVLESGEPAKREDGTISGSNLRMDEAVARAVGIGIDLVAAVAAATQVPADLVGRSDLGRIAPGAMADLVWLDGDLHTRATWIDGEPVFGANEVAA